MIIWVKGDSLNMPNNQRCEVINIMDNNTLTVRMCGQPDRVHNINVFSVCGLEIKKGKKDLDIMFEPIGFAFSE